MGKKRIPVDKKQFEALKNELERVSGIDLSSDNAYYDLCDYIKKQNDIKFPPSKYEDGSIVQQPETISVDTLRRYWGDKDADKQMTPDVGKLSFIARALWYKDWGTFCHEHIQPDTGFDAEKGFNGMDYFKFSSLCENEIICIGWYPQKYCRLKFLGEYSFEVVEVRGMKSEVGRQFETSGFRLAPTSGGDIFPEVIIEPLYEYQEELWNAIENFNIETCPQEILL